MKLRTEHLFFGLMLLIGLGVAAVDSFALPSQQATPASGTPAAVAVVREVLTETEPATAPGAVFQLLRYTIPANLTLPAHTHPGIQMNVIGAGVLTYYVVADGEIQVTRADGTEETFGPGESTTFTVDDAFIEPAGIVHYGANLGTAPVVIVTAALLAADEPPSALVEEATPEAGY